MSIAFYFLDKVQVNWSTLVHYVISAEDIYALVPIYEKGSQSNLRFEKEKDPGLWIKIDIDFVGWKRTLPLSFICGIFLYWVPGPSTRMWLKSPQLTWKLYYEKAFE